MSGRSLWEAFRDSWPAADCPIYDLHGHWGSMCGLNIPLNEDEAAVAYLERAGVKLLVFCHHHSLFSPEIGNAVNISTVRKFTDKLKAYCAINPNYPRIIERDLSDYDNYPDVYAGLKLLPSYHGFALPDDRYRPVFEFADSRGLLLLTHTWGGDRTCGFEQVLAVAEKYPNVRLLLGHSLHGDWDRAVELAIRFPNVYLELTAVPDDAGVVEKLVHGAGSTKVVFGTDFPWFSHYYYVGALLGADITDDERRDILYRNAERLLGL